MEFVILKKRWQQVVLWKINKLLEVVWWFKWEKLFSCGVTLSHTTYQKISEEQMHPFIAAYDSIGIFQQVSESCHTAQVVQEVFQEQREDFTG